MKVNASFVEDRRIQIVEYVEEHGKATVPDLVDFFSVSSATIRNDLKDLNRAKLLIRTHGGAIKKSQTGFELRSKQKTGQNEQAKKEIARIALDLIEDGDTILLDSGTTTLKLAESLAIRRNISVITNSLIIALILEEAESIQVFLMGGFLRTGFQCTVGIAGRTAMEGLTVDKAFMGVNGISLGKGASVPDVNHAEIKKTMIRIAKQVILLCDGTKFGKDSFANFAGLEDIDLIITDSIHPDLRRQFEDNEIEVTSAK